jgi:hypothetical protein
MAIARKKPTGRQIAQTGVVVAARVAHERIDENLNLTDSQRFWAHIAVAALQVGGHVAVEAIANWVDSN